MFVAQVLLMSDYVRISGSRASLKSGALGPSDERFLATTALCSVGLIKHDGRMEPIANRLVPKLHDGTS